MTVVDVPPATALFRIVRLDPTAEGCVNANLAPANGSGQTETSLFCDPVDVDRLKTAKARLGPVAITDAHTLPVTIGLDVSFIGQAPKGGWTLLALPRPAPLFLPAGADTLHREIEKAIADKRSVAFALSGPSEIVDAAAIDRSVALDMLGMRPILK